MLSKKLFLCLLLINCVWLTSCSQNGEARLEAEATQKAEQPLKSKYKSIHQYGGWYCPDNLGNFPPVDIQQLDKVPVVNGRLPTKEETRNGTSLMYFDDTLVPGARPLAMTLPKLARYYSDNTRKNELIIVIQAVVAEEDTVVGFRYVNGGNGSAWFGEVDFLADDEIDQLGATPFVHFNTELNASKEKIWEVITSPTYARNLGELFAKNTFTESDWKTNSKVYFKNGLGKIIRTGTITASWENLYIQVDFNMDGRHYVEKFFIMEHEDRPTTQFIVVAGPFGADFKAEEASWKNWHQKVKELSEGE